MGSDRLIQISETGSRICLAVLLVALSTAVLLFFLFRIPKIAAFRHGRKKRRKMAAVRRTRIKGLFLLFLCTILLVRPSTVLIGKTTQAAIFQTKNGNTAEKTSISVDDEKVSPDNRQESADGRTEDGDQEAEDTDVIAAAESASAQEAVSGQEQIEDPEQEYEGKSDSCSARKQDSTGGNEKKTVEDSAPRTGRENDSVVADEKREDDHSGSERAKEQVEKSAVTAAQKQEAPAHGTEEMDPEDIGTPEPPESPEMKPEYNVVLHSNYGEDVCAVKKVPIGEAFIVSAEESAFSRPGFDHLVWRTEDGGQWFWDHEEVTDLTLESGAEVHLYAEWIDTEPPVVSYEACPERFHTAESLDFSSENITYRIHVTDSGSGVDRDSLYYAVAEPEKKAAQIDASQWKKAGAVSVEGTDGSFTFLISGNAKGAVFVKATDLANAETTADDEEFENDKNGEEGERHNDNKNQGTGLNDDNRNGNRTGGLLTGICPGANKGYARIHLLVLENIAPSVIVEADTPEEVKHSHTFCYRIDDTADNGKDHFSGIRKVSWSLFKEGKKEPEEGYRDRILFAADPDSVPQTLQDLQDYSKKEGSETISGGEDGFEGLGGPCRLVVTAVDFCGNENTAEINDLRFDTTPPAITLHMEGGRKYEKKTETEAGNPHEGEDEATAAKWYYNASEGQDLTVCFQDNDVLANCSLQLLSDGGGTITKVYDRFSGQSVKFDENSLSVDSEPDGQGGSSGQTGSAGSAAVTFVIRAAEMKGHLRDGTVTITVQAQDRAGNRTDKYAEAEGIGDTCFVLDTTCPAVTEICTFAQERGMTVDGTENAVPYDDGKEGSFFYYNEDTVKIAFTIREENPDPYIISWKKDGLLMEKTVLGTGAVLFTEEGRYKEIRICGTDRAGNPLQLQRNREGILDYAFTGKGENGVDQAVDGFSAFENSCGGTGSSENAEAGISTDETNDIKEKRGTVRLCNGKVIDRTPPVADLMYTTDAVVYLYDGTNSADDREERNEQNYGIATGYINRGFQASVQIKDSGGLPLDPEKLSVLEYYEGAEKERNLLRSTETGNKTESQSSVSITRTVTDQKDHSTDGGYYYKVFGTDRAGNPLTVLEYFESNTKIAGIALRGQSETAGCALTYHAGVRLLLDTVCPVFDFSMEDPKGEETVDGDTAYYGSVSRQLTAYFSIMDDHLDADRIGTGYAYSGESKSSHYSELKLYWNSSRSDVRLLYDQITNVGNRFTVRHNMKKEGVYRFAIEGVDKAGNPVLQSELERRKTGFRRTVKVKFSDDKAGSGQPGRFWTTYKVLDTTAPAGTLDIGKYYHVVMDKNGNNTLDPDSYAPYRSEKKADLSIAGTDRSPIRITYRIESTAEGKSLEYNDPEYRNNNARRASVSGEQIFQVCDLVLMDRAGNRSGFLQKGRTKANRIYLDVTPPNVGDVDRPVAAVQANTSVTARHADGRDLFNKGIRLTIRVVDPYQNVSSSGLQTVMYEVKADGRTTLRKTVGEKEGLNSRRASLYEEEDLNSFFEETIEIPDGGRYETNDIEITVNAADNSGNLADTVHYRFGIDTTGPVITVTYDNNEARNEYYFREDRHAVVEVRDRNVDDAKILIQTQTAVPNGIRSIDGGGNGADDLWKKTLSYDRDGEYTLEVSGTDALGNKALVKYSGTAPQKFTIDKTAPTMRIVFDVQHGYRDTEFYNLIRTGTVVITEHNFRPEDVEIHLEGHLVAPDGITKVSPRTGEWGGIEDIHTLTCRFQEDGTYSMSAAYTDLAGNPAEECHAKDFTIDRTKPIVEIMDESVRDGGIYPGKIEPRIRFFDLNYDPEGISFEMTGMKNGTGKNLEKQEVQEDGTGFGGFVRYAGFAVLRANDDIYTASGKITDRAGNEAEIRFSFSVNRFGSTYDYNRDPVTASYVHQYKNREEDMYLREINVNEIESSAVYLTRGTEFWKLEEGREYEVDRDAGSGCIRIYKIFASNFVREGIYDVIIQSTDSAGNKNTNADIREDEGAVNAVPLSFIIDKTNPAVRLRGADPEKTGWQQKSLSVGIVPEDAGRLSKVWIYLDGKLVGTYTDREEKKPKRKNGEQENTEKEISDRNPVIPGEYSLTATLEANHGAIPFVFRESRKPQHLRAVAEDAAGNRSTEKEEILDWTPVVSTKVLTQKFSVLLAGAVGLILVTALLVFRLVRRVQVFTQDGPEL